MPVAVNQPEVACVDSSIFVLDAGDNSELLQLETPTKTWSTKAKPPHGYVGCGVRMVSVKGQLLVAGSRSMKFAQYNPSTNTWTSGNAPTQPHYLGALVHHDQKLYLIGGADQECVEEYDLNSKTWSLSTGRVITRQYNMFAFAI